MQYKNVKEKTGNNQLSKLFDFIIILKINYYVTLNDITWCNFLSLDLES